MKKVLITALMLLAFGANVFAQVPERSRIVNPSVTSTSWFRGAATPTDCTAPTYSWTGQTTTGFAYGGSSSILACSGGSIAFAIGGVDPYRFAFGNDAVLTRDGAAHTIGMRSGANAQAFRIYNTYTDASNYERGLVGWSGNQFIIGTQKAGTGSTRELHLYTAGSDRWAVDGNGHFIAATDNTYDIGASGATRPRTAYLGTGLIIGSNSASTGAIRLPNNNAIYWRNAGNTTEYGFYLSAADLLTATQSLSVQGNVFGASGNNIGWASRSLMSSPSDGVMLFANNASNGFTRLIFGTNDTSGIAWKKNATAFEARLGDDSGYANVTGNTFTASTSFQLATNAQLAVTTGAVWRTAPTISSGFGTSPTITANNGTIAFRINVGTGGTANSGVIGLPTATTGWNCFASDFTTPATGHTIKQTATSTSSATITNYNSAGTATAWTASDVLVVSCFGY